MPKQSIRRFRSYRNAFRGGVTFIGLVLFSACVRPDYPQKHLTERDTIHSAQVSLHTPYSTLDNQYLGFDSPLAINRIANIENAHFRRLNMDSASTYHGTMWREGPGQSVMVNDSITMYARYKQRLTSYGERPYPLDCTLYSIESLKAGMGDGYRDMAAAHSRIWGNDGYAGWSVAHLLTEQFGWTAYLIVSKQSSEYDACVRNYTRDGHYHVWRQPNIRIEALFDFDNDQRQIDSLLAQHEYGWGFSEQGWHTWITRFTLLKECNWLGSPGGDYDIDMSHSLFLERPFLEYRDYDSHVIVFPQKNVSLGDG